MDTLAFGYILPTTGRIQDFHLLETCAAGRTNFETRRLRLREMPCLLFTVQDLYSSSGFFIRTVVFAGTEDVTKALPPMVLPSPITVVPPRIDAPE